MSKFKILDHLRAADKELINYGEILSSYDNGNTRSILVWYNEQRYKIVRRLGETIEVSVQ